MRQHCKYIQNQWEKQLVPKRWEEKIPLSRAHSEYRFDEGRQSELSLQNSYTINEEALGG